MFILLASSWEQKQKLVATNGFCMLSFGLFPGVWILYADVSEHSVCSSFIGK